MTDTVLQVDHLSKAFGGVQAVKDLSFRVGAGEIMGLIGPNGSGKSTTVNLLSGKLRATAGEVRLDGHSMDREPEYVRVSRGLVRTFQTASIFPEFTVREHVRMGSHPVRQTHPLFSAVAWGQAADDVERVEVHITELLALTGLAQLADHKASTISSAQQRFLMIATAMAAHPKILLLDEPAAGLVAHERKSLSALVREIRSRGTAVLIIEHHMALIMEICDRIVVLNFGAKIAEGTPEAIRKDPAVIDAYLGEAV